ASAPVAPSSSAKDLPSGSVTVIAMADRQATLPGHERDARPTVSEPAAGVERWVAVQHVPFEGPGSILTRARARGLCLERCHPYRAEPLPTTAELAGLVVMGGPMGVCDTAAHPHLLGELAL